MKLSAKTPSQSLDTKHTGAIIALLQLNTLEHNMITQLEQTKIADLVNQMQLCTGLGNEENACSIAAINLALTGRLTDDIPECMSEVIGSWIIRIQDRMPDNMRNGPEWKNLLPLAAGTGREHEQQRLALIMDWLWCQVLPTLQPLADEHGFGTQWQTMCVEKTQIAAADAAAADAAYAAAAYADAAYADAAAYAAADAAYAAYAAAAYADAAYADAAAYAAADAARAAARAARADFWTRVNPPALLKQLIEIK